MLKRWCVSVCVTIFEEMWLIIYGYGITVKICLNACKYRFKAADIAELGQAKFGWHFSCKHNNRNTLNTKTKGCIFPSYVYINFRQ